MEHNKSSADKKIYAAIAVAIVALIIGAVGLIVGVTSEDKTTTSPGSQTTVPSGGPIQGDPIYRSQGSSEAPGGGTVKQDENN